MLGIIENSMIEATTRICGVTGPQTLKRAALLFDEIIVCAPLADDDPEKKPYSVLSIIIPGIIPGAFCPVIINRDVGDFDFVLQVCCRLQRDKGSICIPLYGSSSAISRYMGVGQQHLYQASIEAIPTVAEDSIEWEQVLEMRADADAWWKYRAFRSWFATGLKTGSAAEAADVIGARLADYEWAIKKHGLKTATGSLSVLLKSQSLATAAAGAGAGLLLAGPAWAAISAGLIVAGQVAVHVADRLIDLEDVKRGENSEVALLYDIKRAATS